MGCTSKRREASRADPPRLSGSPKGEQGRSGGGRVPHKSFQARTELTRSSDPQGCQWHPEISSRPSPLADLALTDSARRAAAGCFSQRGSRLLRAARRAPSFFSPPAPGAGRAHAPWRPAAGSREGGGERRPRRGRGLARRTACAGGAGRGEAGREGACACAASSVSLPPPHPTCPVLGLR